MMTATVGTMFGSIFISIMEAIFTDNFMNDFGWRIPFLASSIIGVIGWLSQRNMPGSHEFAQAASQNEILTNPLNIAIKDHWKEIAFIAIADAPWSAGFYMIFIWLPNYLANELEPNYDLAFIVNSCLMCWLLITLVLGGYLSDKFHYFQTMTISCFFMVLISIPNFYLIGSLIGPENAPWNMISAQFLFALVLGGFGGPMQIFMVDAIDNVGVRYCVMGIAYNVNQAIFGMYVLAVFGFTLCFDLILICVLYVCFVEIEIERWYCSCCCNSFVLSRIGICRIIFNNSCCSFWWNALLSQ